MTKLADFTQVGSIFAKLKTSIDMPFFTDTPVIVLDNLLAVKYGERIVFEKLLSLSIENIGDMILFTHAKKWQDLILIHDKNYDIGASKVNVVSEVVSNLENRTNTRDDLNKVAAYNSDVLITNDGSNSNTVDVLDGSTTRTVTDSTIDLMTAYNNLSLASKNNIIEIVIYDVADFLTLSIY